jgi:hypothetical protein
MRFGQCAASNTTALFSGAVHALLMLMRILAVRVQGDWPDAEQGAAG